MRRGVSLVEIALAFVILGLAILPVLTLIGGSGRQAAQTAEYSLALALEQKVAEELRAGAWENVHLADTLAGDPSFAVPLPIVDGISPFFATVEDSAAPFGETITGRDAGIAVEYPVLHRQVNGFTLLCRAEPAPITEGAALDCQLVMQWSDPVVTGRRLDLDVRLPRRVRVTRAPPEVEDRDVADPLIVEMLYPAEIGRPLDAIAATHNADARLVRALGDAALVSQALTDSTTAVRVQAEAAAAAIAAAPGTLAAARAQLAVARLHERRAALLLQAAAYLLEPLRGLAGAEVARLGAPPPALPRAIPGLQAIAGLPAAFERELLRARADYAAAYAQGAVLRPRQRMRVLMKLLEVSKVAALAVGPADTGPIRQILADLERLQDGRNRNFAQFARAEARLCADIGALRARYPATTFDAVRELRNVAPEALRRVGGDDAL